MELPKKLPMNRHVVRVSSWTNPKSTGMDIVQSHPLNQQLEVFLPTATPSSVGVLARQGAFYYSLRLHPRELIEECLAHPDLRYYAILQNAPQDGANSMALYPNGELILSLDHDTYTQFGLIGHRAALPPGLKSMKSTHGNLHVIAIDVHALQADSPFKSRVFACLERFGPVDLFVCATHANGQVQTVSITHDSAHRRRLELNAEIYPFDNIVLPQPTSSFPIENADSTTSDPRHHIQDVHEWLGVMACRIEGLLQRASPDEYVSSYQVPGVSSTERSRATSVRWRGLIPESFCAAALDYAKTQVAEQAVPWAAVLVWGFPDTLASWYQQGKRRDHGYQMEGANGYTIVCLPGDSYWVIQSLGAQDSAA
ncbi:hypothetical protein H310_08622 [Aphanomyces invadans]|uniref:Uncharacterized protein n=1 Tax=Aphanomyces invadans TaxID=157072 RepID=A0A024TWZ3_9STRA|nr:hypothetical protein H310_08622 [Aphanomyces invadans]ETV98484.1 hypothetical protein H310_08622 [Aphanomyces invadans]|eukprot:XP_008872681.1 hypothetical protein H310_08622 [Aphanomyces invadans]